MITPSVSDLAKLFIALGEQTKASTVSIYGRHSAYVPKDLVRQFNMLAQAANEIAHIKIVQIDEASPQPTAQFLAQVNLAAEIARVRDDSSIKEEAAQINSGTAEARARKPRVFIGCSTEGLRYAKIIQLQLAHATRTAIWNQGVFGLSMGTLESLVAERSNWDYAILVLTPDDTRVKRAQEGPIPRDNVIFELGLFMGTLGREHVFMVVQRDTELPTDLAGVTPAIFDPKEEINLVSALGPVTTMLEIAMGLI
jgi:predicted nucleotide-binding protein